MYVMCLFRVSSTMLYLYYVVYTYKYGIPIEF